MAGKSKEKVAFALDVLEDTWDALRANGLDQVSQQPEQITLDPFLWEEIRSTLAFTIKILKGEVRRGE